MRERKGKRLSNIANCNIAPEKLPSFTTDETINGFPSCANEN